MADEQWKKTNIMFGSAGMAASGMLPQPVAKSKPKPKPEPEPEPVVVMEEAPVIESIFEEDIPEEDIVEVLPEPEAAPEPEPKPEPIIEPVQITGYGINSKAQGLFTDLKIGILADGSRTIDGCNWDTAFEGIDGIVVKGVSDPDEESLKELQQTHSFEGGFSDYRELLARSKPNLVVIPQRGTQDRYEMIKNCLMSGSHVICPGPFARSLEDADELVALADRRGLKLAVAYPMRLDPNVVRFHQSREELIGDLVEIRVFGQMDETAGGEDLLVKGAPMFDLVRMFAGNPVWTSATVLTNGERSTREDIVEDSEKPWGPLVGDTVNAHFFTEQDVMVTFTSNQKLKNFSGGWGMEFIGSKGMMRLFGGDQPTLSLLDNPGERSPESDERWIQWPNLTNPYHPTVDGLEGADAANRLAVADWLEAIAEDRKAETSGARAIKALEMVHAVFQSTMSSRKVYFPMANRHHPLTPEVKPYEVDFQKSA